MNTIILSINENFENYVTYIEDNKIVLTNNNDVITVSVENDLELNYKSNMIDSELMTSENYIIQDIKQLLSY